MAHQRKLIRYAVKALLTDVTAAKGRVFATRIDPLKRSQIPAVSVYTLEETSDDEGTAPRELTRELDLEIAGWVTPGENVDDAMDDLALQIETAMHADRTLGGTASDSRLVKTTTGLQPEGDLMMGLVTLSYAVTYRTLAPEPAVPGELADFLIAGVTHNLGGAVHEDNQVHDEVVVQEVA